MGNALLGVAIFGAMGIVYYTFSPDQYRKWVPDRRDLLRHFTEEGKSVEQVRSEFYRDHGVWLSARLIERDVHKLLIVDQLLVVGAEFRMMKKEKLRVRVYRLNLRGAEAQRLLQSV